MVVLTAYLSTCTKTYGGREGSADAAGRRPGPTLADLGRAALRVAYLEKSVGGARIRIIKRIFAYVITSQRTSAKWEGHRLGLASKAN